MQYSVSIFFVKRVLQTASFPSTIPFIESNSIAVIRPIMLILDFYVTADFPYFIMIIFNIIVAVEIIAIFILLSFLAANILNLINL